MAKAADAIDPTDLAPLIIGQRLLGTTYYQMEVHTDVPAAKVERVDYGVDLDFEDATLAITWSVIQDLQGLVLVRNRMTSLLYPGAAVQATPRSWETRVNRRIRSTGITWARPESSMPERPLTLALAFEDGKRVFITASSFDVDSGTLEPFADELSVVFDEDWLVSRGLSV
jgi:hypothetical protein